jgi:putative flavoprotein involved in K+ transport
MNTERTIAVVVIGGGQAGLAMSQCLSGRSIDHVVLERGEVANSWRTERWDSLRLLTPNWLSRLPGFAYDGDDPDGYMTAPEVVDMLRRYQTQIDAPIITGVRVESITSGEHGHVVSTSEGTWRARAVVLATGACSTPHVPAIGAELPTHIEQLSPISYRNPDQLGGDRVLVVGASASGMQLADELARAGRDVTLAVGDHVRVPRSYRGMDIHWWMDAIGALDERYDEVDDIARARRLPSFQLVGTPERRDLDLNSVIAHGVTPVGRFVGVDRGRAQFSGSLANHCAAADLKQARLLDRIDEYATAHGLDGEVGPIDRPAPTRLGEPVLGLDLASIDTVVWATGFRPDHGYLDPSLLDRRGRIVHDGGVMTAPGMYALGLPFMRRRKSAFIDGVGRDAEDLVGAIHAHLDARSTLTSTTRSSGHGDDRPD